MTTLAGVGRRVNNTRRAHLLVSAVLGKHVPVDCEEISAVAGSLASLIEPSIVGEAYVITYAEAGIGVGTAVAWSLEAPVISSTRGSGAGVWCEFVEPHSHAASHSIIVKPEGIEGCETIILVDDEMTTGVTAMNTISALRETGDVTTNRFVIATIIDARSDNNRLALDYYASEYDLDITVVALENFTGSTTPSSQLSNSAPPLEHGCPAVLIDESIVVPPLAQGWSAYDMAEIDAEVSSLAWRLRLDVERRTLVLGTEEFMWPAQRLAKALGGDVSSTTASPVVVDPDAHDYPIRHGFSFSTPAGTRFAYNTDGYDQIVVVSDDVTTTPTLLPTQSAWCVLTSRSA